MTPEEVAILAKHAKCTKKICVVDAPMISWLQLAEECYLAEEIKRRERESRYESEDRA